MENEISKLLTRIEYLESVTKFNQENLLLTWAILGVIVGALALTGFAYIKKWVNERTDKELQKFKKEVLNEVTDYRVTTTMRHASISGIQTISHSNKIHAILIQGYFQDENITYNYMFTKDKLMYTEKGASHDSIKILYSNGATTEVRVKQLVENGFELEWAVNGEIPDVTVGLDILIL